MTYRRMVILQFVQFYLYIFFVSVAMPTKLQAGQDHPDYLTVTGPCHFNFPQDHGAHTGYRTEWWYYSGNLSDASNRRFGFLLTIFRRQISPIDAPLKWPVPPSSWRTQQIYLGHAAVSDISNRQHHFDETAARDALEMAGVRRTETDTRVFIKDWSIRIGRDQQRLFAETERFSLDLHLEPLKPPVAHGNQGYSLKGDTLERASCYYSQTRLHTRGVLTLDGRSFNVTGQSWMDHEFSTALLQPGIVGWDWFSLQLSDDSELMFFLLRQENGDLNQASSGTLVRTDGRQRHLSIGDVGISAQSEWRSAQSGAVYPQDWEILIPSEQITLKVQSAFPKQEMRTRDITGVTYWEGSVKVEGVKKGLPVTGTGYVEMTGYAETFNQPL